MNIVLDSILMIGFITLTIIIARQSKKIGSIETKIRPDRGIKEGDKVFVADIPGNVTVDDIDTDYKVLKDIIQSIDIENWETEVEKEYSTFSQPYKLTFSNPAETIKMIVRIYLELDKKKNIYTPSIGFIIIGVKDEHHITYDKKTMGYDIDLFFTKKILDYHTNIRKETTIEIQNTLNHINKELKTLNRDRKLNNLIN